MKTIAEETENTQAEATNEQPKATKKATGAKRARNVASKKGKAAKATSAGKKAPKGGRKTTGTREGSKTAAILELLQRPGGATSKELLKATGWQAHSVRGFISGTLGKKLGLTVVSTKGEDGERSYSVKG